MNRSNRRHHKNITEIQNVLVSSGVFEQIFSLRHLLKCLNGNNNNPIRTDGSFQSTRGTEIEQPISAYESQLATRSDSDDRNRLLQQVANKIICATSCKQTLFDKKEVGACSSNFFACLSQVMMEVYACNSANVLFNLVSFDDHNHMPYSGWKAMFSI